MTKPENSWTFPPKSPCPYEDCRSPNTEHRSTQGPAQYRRCLVCGRSYKVIGRKVNSV